MMIIYIKFDYDNIFYSPETKELKVEMTAKLY